MRHGGPMSASCEIILARHAATASNLVRPYILQGQGMDGSLDEQGRRQAAALAETLASFKIDRVYASPLKRAMETADAIARAHGRRVEAVAGLIEAKIGEWEGLNWSQIHQRWPAEAAAFEERPDEQPYVGGESYTDVWRRAGAAVADLAQKCRGERIVVVGHNVVNRALLAGWLAIPLRFARKVPQNNAGYSVLTHDGARARVRTINVIAHLDGLLPDE